MGNCAAIVILLAACCASAQLPENLLLSAGPPAAAAGAAVVGPPAVYMVRTNSSGSDVTAGTQLTNWVDFSTDANRLGLFLVDWYPNTASLTNAKIAGTNLTLYTRTNNASPVACEVRYLLSPPTGYQLCSLAWNATVNQVVFHSLAVTNATNSGTFQNGQNWASDTDGRTNTITSATNSLAVGYYVADLAGAGELLATNAESTVRAFRASGTAQECSAVLTQPGIGTATLTNWAWFDNTVKCLGSIFRVEGMRQ